MASPAPLVPEDNDAVLENVEKQATGIYSYALNFLSNLDTEDADEAVPLQKQYKMSPVAECLFTVLLRCFELFGLLMGMLMGMTGLVVLLTTLLVAIIPGLVIKGFVMAVAWLFIKGGASEEAVHNFLNGGDDPEALPECCNRHTMRLTEMKRGENLWTNYKYYVCNTHPVLGMFWDEPGHPFAPFERLGLFVLITSWGYFMKVAWRLFVPEDFFHWEKTVLGHTVPMGKNFYTAFFISGPACALLSVATYLALADYAMNLKREGYEEKMSDERELHFVQSFISSIGAPVGGGRSARMDAQSLKKERHGCSGKWFELVAWTYSTVSELFGYTCWLFSGLLVYLALHQEHTDVSLAYQMVMVLWAVFVNWFPISFAAFFVFWKLEHMQGVYNPVYSHRMRVGLPFLGPTEAEEELLNVFDRIDADGSGVLTSDELLAFCKHAFPDLSSDQIVEEVLKKLDKDGDHMVGPNEFLTLLPLYCKDSGWYHKSLKRAHGLKRAKGAIKATRAFGRSNTRGEGRRGDAGDHC